MRDLALKKQSDERRRAERKQRHLQDDLRYALKKMPEPLDVNISFEDVRHYFSLLIYIYSTLIFSPGCSSYRTSSGVQGRCRRRGKARGVLQVHQEAEGEVLASSNSIMNFYADSYLQERLREVTSEDGASTTSRKRKEPPREHDKERDKDRGDRERDSHRDRGKEYDKDSRSKHYHRHDSDYDAGGHRSSHREYAKEKEHSSRDDKDRDYGRSSKHYERDDGRKRERERERKGYRDEAPKEEVRERERSVPAARGEDRIYDDRAEKVVLHF